MAHRINGIKDKDGWSYIVIQPLPDNLIGIHLPPKRDGLLSMFSPMAARKIAKTLNEIADDIEKL